MDAGRVMWVQVYDQMGILCCTPPCATPDEAAEMAEIVGGQSIGLPQPVEVPIFNQPTKGEE